MSKYLLPRLNALDPYVPGEQPQDRRYIKLNTNESPFAPSPRVLAALDTEAVGRMNLYPDPIARVLRDGETVAKVRGTSDASAIHALLSETPGSKAA